MNTMTPKIQEIFKQVVARNPGEDEFHQAVAEVLESLGQVSFCSSIDPSDLQIN
jgi:glutamate dehydrogenase (NADP+)